MINLADMEIEYKLQINLNLYADLCSELPSDVGWKEGNRIVKEWQDDFIRYLEFYCIWLWTSLSRSY